MVNLPFGIPIQFSTIVADSSTITNLAFPEAGDCTFDINLTADCSPTITGGNAAIVQTMRLVFHTNGFTVTLPAGVVGGGLPVGLNCDLVLVIESEAGAMRVVEADAYPASTPVTTSPQPTGGVFSMNANLCGPGDGSIVPGIAGTNYPILGQSEFTYLAGKGIKKVRIPGLWGRLQPGWSTYTTGSALPAIDDTYIGYYTTAATYAGSVGMKVLVEPMHNYGRLTINGTSQVFGDGVLTSALFASSWGLIATRLVGNPNIEGYDLMNEPHDLVPSTATIGGVSVNGQAATLFTYTQAAITAIRAVDKTTKVIVEGLQYASAYFWPTLNIGLEKLEDPSGLIVYEAHAYPDRDSSGSHYIWEEEVAAGDQLLASGPSTTSPLLAIGQSTDVAPNKTIQTPTTIPVTLESAPTAAMTWQYRRTGAATWTTAGTTAAGAVDFIFTGLVPSAPGALSFYDIQAAGIAVLPAISTCGVLDETILVRRFTPFVQWLNQYGLKGVAGEFGFGNDDPAWNRVGANALAFFKTSGLEAYPFTAGPYYRNYPYGLEPTNGVDTRQMAVVCQAAGVPDAPTLYLLSGPTRGQPSTVTTPFTVDVRGIISSPFTITPNDLGGGTFSPASLPVPAGLNFLGTFTYTPPATAKTVSIGCTNTGGLTDAIAIGFSTIADEFVQTGTVAQNILWPTLMDTTHIGPAVNLYRTSDATTENFYFVNGSATVPAIVDQTSIAAWAGSSAVTVATAYDQSPHQNNAGPIDGNNDAGVGNVPVATSPSQYPTYVVNGANSLPLLRFATSKMDANSPINGLAGLTVIFAVNPKSIGDCRCMISWDFVQTVQLTDQNGNYVISTDSTTTQSAGMIPGSLNVYAMVFDGVGELRTAYVNGNLLSQQAASEAVLTFVDRSNINLGYFRFYNQPINFDLFGYVIFQQALTAAQLAVFHTRMLTDAGVVFPNQAFGLKLNGTITTTTIPVILPTVPANAASLVWQRRVSGGTAWITDSTQAVTAGQTNVTHVFSSLTPNTSYDVQAVPANGSYQGIASSLLGQKTTAIAAGASPPIPYLGMNISGLDLNFSFTQNQAHIQHFASLGFNVFRIPFKWELIQPTLGGTIDPTYLANMMNYVNLGTQLGVQILLDMHNYGAYNGNLTLSSGGPTTAQLSNCWVQIATSPGIMNNPNVRLGIQNEPHIDTADWTVIHNQIVSDLRAAGVTDWVHAAVNNGPMLGVGSINGFVDSLNKTYFEGHQYTDPTQQGKAAIAAANLSDYIALACRAVQLYRQTGSTVKLFWGEVGFDTGATAMASLALFLGYIQQNAATFNGITFWSAGQEFGTNYVYDMNDTNGTDMPQTVYAQQFLPGGAQYGYNNPIIAYQGSLVSSTTASYSAAGTGPFPNSAQGSVWELTAMFQAPYSVTPSSSTACTMETMFALLPGTFVGGSLLGANGTMWVTTSGTSSLEFRMGNGTTAVLITISIAAYLDGKPHHVEFGADATGIYIFIDGVLKGSSTTSFAASGPTLNTTSGVRSSGKNGGGSTSFGLGNVAFWSYLRHSANFTPPTDYYTGMEPGLFAFFPLNGNLNCYL